MMATYDPVEIVMSDRTRQANKLREAFKKQQSSSALVDIERRYFSDTEGMLFLKNPELVVLGNVTLKGLEPKYLAVAAAFALHKYCSFVQRVPNGLPLVKVSLRVHEDILLLEHSTVQTLELIENSKTGKQRSGSLFAAINHTKTAMGARLLRASLLQPLQNPAIISARLDAVDQLTTQRDLYFGLQKMLEQFPDLERVSSTLLVKTTQELSFSSIGPVNPNTIVLLLHLKTALTKIFEIVPLLEELSGESVLLRNILGALKTLCSASRPDGDGNDNTPGSVLEPSDSEAGFMSSSEGEPPRSLEYSSVDSGYSSTGGASGSTALERIQNAIATKLSDGQAAAPRGGEQLRLQAVNVIANGVDGYLDKAREVYSDLVDDIHAYREQLAEEYGMDHNLCATLFPPQRSSHCAQRRVRVVYALAGSCSSSSAGTISPTLATPATCPTSARGNARRARSGSSRPRSSRRSTTASTSR